MAPGIGPGSVSPVHAFASTRSSRNLFRSIREVRRTSSWRRGQGYLLAGTAALGSYTTFSTWMLEAQRLGEDGEVPGLAANVVLSLAAGLVAAALGRAIGAGL